MSPAPPSPASSAAPAAPGRVGAGGGERRRLLRQQRRQERLRNLWRLLVLSALAAGVGYGLLRYGWTLQQPGQVEVVGSQLVGRDQVIAALGLRFPVPLLSLQPRRIAAELSSSLPVEQVQVSRLMAPPRLRVSLMDREAVALAQRRGPQGLERGYVDRLGNWMSRRQGIAAPRSLSLTVLGWQGRHRPALAELLEWRQPLGSDLREIRFDPSGSIWLSSATLGQVRLGPADSQFDRRLEVLLHLRRTLPQQLQGRRLQSIDLSDPNQPELGLPAPPSRPQAPGSAPAAGSDSASGRASAPSSAPASGRASAASPAPSAQPAPAPANPALANPVAVD